MSRPSKSPQPTAATSTPDAPTGSRAPWLCLLVFAAALLAYIPALSGGLLWDDPGHITRPDLRFLAGLGRIWFEIGATQQYYPVLHSAFWFEHLLWGDSTFAYHLLNVLLHATAACLFARLLQRLAIPGAWFAALLFALHPVCVESVAWISEQKNTLSAVFYLLAALAYLRFHDSRRPAQYAAATALFVLALLTKTVTASLPAALLVVFWWRQGRIDRRHDVLPLLPWFALGALSGLGTAHFERELIGAQGSDFALAFDERLLLAGRVVWFYLGKLVWPAELIFIYPRWTVDAAQWWQWIFLAAGLAFLAALLWLALAHRRRGPLATALLFGGTLFPVLGFFNVYPFLFSYVADHFQYLASLAVFALAGAGLSVLAARLSRRTALGAAALLLGTLGTLTCLQSRMYRDVTTLYETTLERNPSCWMAHQNLAIALAESGQVDAAIAHLRTALAIKPDNAAAENNLGDNLTRLGRLDEALPHLQRAVELQPNYVVGHCNLATTLARLHRFEEAFPHFAEAARLDPRYPQTEQNWGIALMESGQPAQAFAHLARAVEIAPGWVEGRIYFGRALAGRNRMQEAADQFRSAVEAAPGSGEANYLLGMALRSLGRTAEADAYLEAAQQCGPSTP
jgi:Flp pilus assembly protein TadD